MSSSCESVEDSCAGDEAETAEVGNTVVGQGASSLVDLSVQRESAMVVECKGGVV